MAEPVVTVNGLAQRFGQVAALHGVDFEAAAGTIFGQLGRNGANKTTEVQVLTTILAPDRGTASVLGPDVVRHADTVRLNIGLAGQPAGSTPTSPGARTRGDRTPRADPPRERAPPSASAARRCLS